jgi:hypothetical protein
VAQIAVGAYHVFDAREYGGYAAYINVLGPCGGKKRLNLGNHRTMEKAKRACERHFEAGCDVGHAERL